MATAEKKKHLAEFLEGTSRAPEYLLAQWTERLRSGERGAEADGIARRVMRDFIVRQWLGQPHSAATLEWLADVLNEVLQDKKPLDAFGLAPRPAHRQGDPTLAIDVALWLAATESRGYSPAEAVGLAAETFHRNTKAIEGYRRYASEWAAGRNPNATDADWESHFLSAKPPRPLPPAKSKK